MSRGQCYVVSACMLVRWHTSIPVRSKICLARAGSGDAIWRFACSHSHFAYSIRYSWSGRRTFVCPSHAIFSAFCKCARSTKARADHARAEGPSFLSLRSIFNSWPFIYTYAFFAGGLCERFFCASSNRLARVCICFDELLRIPSSVRGLFR